MKKNLLRALAASLLALTSSLMASDSFDPKADLKAFDETFDTDTLASGRWESFSRGKFSIADGVLSVSDGWVATGATTWTNYSMTVRARAPESNRQVQIWAGFRHFSRDYRYVVGLRGGNNNHLYLARYGAEGHDRMLDVVPLDFSPSPGTWYTLKVVAAGQNIAVYLNEEADPRILVKDDGCPFAGGGVSLGGSYLPTEFDFVKVSPVEASALDGVKKQSPIVATKEQKEAKRKAQRQAYRPYYVQNLQRERNEFPLNGNWLFIPDSEAKGNVAALNYDDSLAHVIDVPNLWVPFAAWLEGEGMPGGLNKGQNDKLHRIEEERCSNYTFDYRPIQFAWYRHSLDLPENIGSKKVVIDFQGIALISAIYFNGEKIQDNIGMFSPQKIDVTNRVKPGRNVIAVQVWREWKDDLNAQVSTTIDDNYADAWNVIADADKGKLTKLGTGGRETKILNKHIPAGFYQNKPAGIWRDVTLIITNKVKIEEFFFKPTLTNASIDVSYANYGSTPQTVALNYEIKNCATGEVLCEGRVEEKKLGANEVRKVSFTTPKVAPKLWGPGQPNLYLVTFRVLRDADVIDQYSEKVGFRTVAVKGDEIILNGKPVWIRGANHMPGHMKPYDKELAKKFMALALEHNVMATRTHCSPYSKQWMDAADEAGVLISFEGPYPWLMLRDFPSEESINIYKREMANLVRANRNRPSVFLWTMNNEMKFFIIGDSEELIIEKGKVLTEAIKIVRNLDPTRPVIADSAYYRKHLTNLGRYERIITKNNIDEGDLDDPHGYFNWYNGSFFNFFNGEFGEKFHTPGRAMLGQEFSTGYPRADDALPTRAYLFLHQTPQTTVGKDAYEESDPNYFISRQAMLTKEMVEIFRRVEHSRTSGAMMFAFHTWFYSNHEVNQVAPMLTASKLKQAYQPVLASAELWGRHFYAGDTLKSEVTLINDSDKFNALTAAEVVCQLVVGDRVIASSKLAFGKVKYYATKKRPLELPVPVELSGDRVDARLVLRVMANGAQISKNEYDVILATKAWAFGSRPAPKEARVVMENDTEAQNSMEFFGLKFRTAKSVAELKDYNSVLIVADSTKVPDYDTIKQFVLQGGKAILLNNGKSVIGLFPNFVKGYKPFRHEIVTMNVKEHKLFDGLAPLDIAWFSDNKEVPYAATGRFSVDRFSPNVTVIAGALEWHGYLTKPQDYRKFGGVPLFQVALGKGKVLVSELRRDAVGFDPINGRIMANILYYNFE